MCCCLTAAYIVKVCQVRQEDAIMPQCVTLTTPPLLARSSARSTSAEEVALLSWSSRKLISAGIRHTANAVKRKVRPPPSTIVSPQPTRPAIAATYTCPTELAALAASEWPDLARPRRWSGVVTITTVDRMVAPTASAAPHRKVAMPPTTKNDEAPNKKHVPPSERASQPSV